MLGSPDQDDFISRSVAAILTTVRSDGSPSASMISYARDGDRLLFTSTADRAKYRMLRRDARAVMTILNPESPWSFVSVEGLVTVHEDNPIELRRIFLRSTEHPLYPMNPAEVDEMIGQHGRAMFELAATRVAGVVVP